MSIWWLWCWLTLSSAEAGELLTQMTGFLDASQVTWVQIDGRTDAVRASIPGPSGQGYLVVLQERDQQKQALVYVIHPTRMPEHRRSQLAEYVARANYGLPIGNFEIDMSDGEFRFKNSVDVEGGVLSPKMAENLVVQALRVMDRYAAGAVRVGFDHRSAPDAIREIEGSQE